ncbi:putative SH3 and Ded_cyto domain protein [Phyllosticta capitalensis]|uniref:SH3 and Ded_cyto domain protein n=1 Tax=Phyllosticta capitalensis TaxID=121624 RepID=A0ABR1Z5G2_9PEZI
MPWRPVPRIAFAICTYPFQPSSPADLPLEIGDELYIIEQGGKDGAWYRGYLVAPPSLLAGLTSSKGQTLEARVFSGIFPRCCVEVREVLGESKANGIEDDGAANGHQRAASEDHGSDGEHPVNGLITPDESSTSSPATAKSQSRASNNLGLALTPKDAKRSSMLLRQGSQKGKREASGYFLPLSPVSVASRDPNAPKPPAPVPMLKIGDETPTSLAEPLVDEIASCLREWHSTKVHELLLGRRYGTLEKMTALVLKLDSARRQLLHKVLTKKELDVVRERTVWDLVAGNKMLSGEVIVRSPSQKGRILTSDDSAIEVTRLQSIMSLLDERPIQTTEEHTLYHVAATVRNYVGEIKHPSTLCMYLCSKTPGAKPLPLSEVFAIDLVNQEGGESAISEEKIKTLFTDLSAVDVGEGSGAGANTYLVVKILGNEPARMTATPMPHPSATRDGSISGQGGLSSSGSINRGRRSLMWSASRRKNSDPGEYSGLRPTQSTVSRPSSERSDSAPARAVTPKEPKALRRTFAIGVLRLDFGKERQELEQEVSLWTPSNPLDEMTEEAEKWDELVSELNPSVTGVYKRYPFMNRLQINVKNFGYTDAETLIKKTPTLLHNVVQSKKIGFSGAPTKYRSDIYLTLRAPFLPQNCFLAHPKSGSVALGQSSNMANLQLTLEVRKASGDRIENCIFPAGNSNGHTAWRTTAIERGESWNLTIRFAINPEDVAGSHVVMSLADAPGFPFALCWMPLWTDDAFVRDGEHTLAMYKYDEHTSSMIAGRGAYLSLPWNSQKKDEAITGTMASIKIRTYLCSTKYSQDPNLLSLLKWRDQGSDKIADLLKRFLFVPEIEIVKLLPEVFDSLFEILVENAGRDEIEDLVFNALVNVLGIVHDRRFDMSPLVDKYVQTRFNYPFATAALVRSFNRLLSNPNDPATSRALRSTFKVGAHIFKFIMRARLQQKDKEAGIGITGRQSTFTKDMQNIFKALESLMTNTAPILVGTKTLLVQHFHTWLPELTICLTPTEVLELASSFIDSCASVQSKLILYKLILIMHLNEVEAFKTSETRSALVSKTVKWLAPHWGKTGTVNDQWREQVRLCCSVVASQIEGLGPEAADYIPKIVDSYLTVSSAPRPTKQHLSLLFPTSYPFPSKQIETTVEFDEILVELLAILAAITNFPITIHPELPKDEMVCFLSDTLQVLMASLDGGAFPKTWLSTNIYHHKATMKALEKLSGVLIDSFIPDPDQAEEFATDLWRSFFDTLLKLVSSDALALETFPEQKRRAVWKIAGDVRELGAELLRRSWDAIGWETTADDRDRYGLEKMGGYQVQYVPGLVAPIVELCLSVHQGLRSVAIQVLQTMIVSEWSLSEDLSLIQAEMIDCLDRLFKTKNLTESVIQKLFINELIDLFEPMAQDPDDALFNAVKDLINTIDELLDLLVAVHGRESSGEVFHIMDTLHLMEFLKDMQKEDIYIRYVHQLAQIQAAAGNKTEAGLAIRLHAELYDWDPTTTVQALEDPAFPSQTAFDRKEHLYFEMIKHYEDGLSWSNALAAYQELAAQYEHNVFDFAKLARTQRAMATVYESINRGDRQLPRYFRVTYRGMGWPHALRDKQFVFEGSPMDSRATFTDRLQQQHPSAQISTGAQDEDVEGQYLEIFSVGPQKDLMHPIYQRPKIAQTVRDYYVLSSPNKFSTTSRLQGANETNIKDRRVHKVIYTTSEPFPTILRRSEIVSVEEVIYTPLQTALERTIRKTAELASLEKRVANGEDSALQMLTESLMLSVDSKSPNSVAQYRELLPKPLPPVGSDAGEGDDDDVDDGERLDPPLEPLENALKNALMDHALMVKRCLGTYTRPAQLATAQDLSGRFEQTFAPELEALHVGQLNHLLSSPNYNSSSLLNPSIAQATVIPLLQAAPSPAAFEKMRLSAAALLPSSALFPSPSPDTTPRAVSRNEKNRLSLTFLKRSSASFSSHGHHASDSTVRSGGQKNNTTNQAPQNLAAALSAAAAAGGDRGGGLRPATDDGAARQSTSRSHSFADTTATSNTATSTTSQSQPEQSARRRSHHRLSFLHSNSSTNESTSALPKAKPDPTSDARPGTSVSENNAVLGRISSAAVEGGKDKTPTTTAGGLAKDVKKRLSLLNIGRMGSKGQVRVGESVVEEQ